MTKIWTYLKPFDYFFILLALILSFLPQFITFYAQWQQPDIQTIAIIKINGIEVDRFELYDGAPNIEKTYYPSDTQYNIVEREGTHIRIKEDNSPDQIGVRTGWIYRVGQTAICLPHHFIIEIQGEAEADPLILPLS